VSHGRSIGHNNRRSFNGEPSVEGYCIHLRCSGASVSAIPLPPFTKRRLSLRVPAGFFPFTAFRKAILSTRPQQVKDFLKELTKNCNFFHFIYERK